MLPVEFSFFGLVWATGNGKNCFFEGCDVMKLIIPVIDGDY
jgi:hypothetical protein